MIAIIDYNMGNNSNEFMRDNGTMLQALSDKLKPFKEILRDIESIKRYLSFIKFCACFINSFGVIISPPIQKFCQSYHLKIFCPFRDILPVLP